MGKDFLNIQYNKDGFIKESLYQGEFLLTLVLRGYFLPLVLLMGGGGGDSIHTLLTIENDI